MGERKVRKNAAREGRFILAKTSRKNGNGNARKGALSLCEIEANPWYY